MALKHQLREQGRQEIDTVARAWISAWFYSQIGWRVNFPEDPKEQGGNVAMQAKEGQWPLFWSPCLVSSIVVVYMFSQWVWVFCVTLGKMFNLSVLLLPHLYNEYNNFTYRTGLLWNFFKSQGRFLGSYMQST